MPNPTATPQPQPTPTPRPALSPQPSLIVFEPATVAACQQDYAAAADVRTRLDDQIRGHQ